MSEAPFSAHLEIPDTSILLALSGPRASLLGEVARASGAEVSLRGNVLHFSGDERAVRVARRFMSDAAELVGRGYPLAPNDIARSMRSLESDPSSSLTDLLDQVIVVAAHRKPVVAKGPAQRRYIETIRTHDLTFAIGPAGTGKTYLAMAVAVSALLGKEVKRIILTRPAVEAGEKLGFLPGDLADKVNPYLRPLYDALHDMIDFERVEAMRERGQIEVAPLAFMRGRTLNESFVILDEAQNATSEQMRMFLTRLGFGSRAVVTGDVTQTDLPSGARSGLREARALLDGIDGIGFASFDEADVVRHPLVQKIIVAYERRDAERARERAERDRASWAMKQAARAAVTRAREEPPLEPPSSGDERELATDGALGDSAGDASRDP